MTGTPLSGSELAARTRWYIGLRWLLLAAIVLPSLGSLYVGNGWTDQRILSLVMTAVLFGTNGLFHVLVRLKRSAAYYRLLAAIILTFDVLFITYFIYTKGGIESRSQLLYALPILMAAALFGRLMVYLTGLGAAIAYDAVIAGNFWGILHSPDTLTRQATNGTYVLNTIVFFTAVLMVVALMADFITRLLLQKQQEAVSTAAALRRAQAIAKIGSWEWDVASDTIAWSDELYQIFGVSPVAHLDYEGFIKLIHPEDRQWTADIIARSLKNHKPFSFDNRIVLPNKTIRYLHGEGKVALDRRGRVKQLYGTAQDMTAERMLEAAKGNFVSLASHQLRTPAGAVRILLSLLLGDYIGRLTSRQKHTVQQAYDANERLLRIADDLLNVAKIEAGRMALVKQQIELVDWLRTVAGPQQLLAKENRQKIVLKLPAAPVHLLGDASRLGMVLDNLLSNARKYSPPRGTIELSLLPGRRYHRIVVRDSGNGMTRAELSKLFDKFSRLNNPASKSTEGTGLGLYLAKSIVNLHGGSISVRSRVGSGSIFTIRLPKAAV